MRQLSYWEQKSLLPSSDIIVIGAGIVGLTAARIIAENHPKYSVSVIEKDVVGSTASSRNAGFACFGSVSEILSDLEIMEKSAVANLIQTRKDGLRMLVARYGAQKLRLNLCGGYELYESRNLFEKDAQNLDLVNQLIDSRHPTFSICPSLRQMKLHEYCFLNNEEGHLDTGQLYMALVKDCESRGVKIHRGIEVLSIAENAKEITLELKGLGSIKTPQLIVATNALTKRLIFSENVIPARNQVLVTTPIPNHNLSGTYHMDAGYVYLRDIGDRVLIGGARNLFKAESTDIHGINEENITYLKSILEEKVIPHVGPIQVEYKWSGIIAPKPSKLPIVKKHSNRITMGVRLGGMGVAIGMKIGQEVATLSMS
ncbi:MAG: gamma-glutamylputrescine oxidase [Saprospiraceae bacterium]|jgi:gamma-glutamylputrescine oxidase